MLERAGELFVKALRLDGKSVWAAMGVACISAELTVLNSGTSRSGEHAAIRDVFSLLHQEVCNSTGMPLRKLVATNYAHALIEAGGFEEARVLYQNLLSIQESDLNPREHLQVFLFIARAYYLEALSDDNGQRDDLLKAAVDTLQRASGMEAADSGPLLFNQAICWMAMEEFERAQKCLKDAQSTKSPALPPSVMEEAFAGLVASEAYTKEARERAAQTAAKHAQAVARLEALRLQRQTQEALSQQQAQQEAEERECLARAKHAQLQSAVQETELKIRQLSHKRTSSSSPAEEGGKRSKKTASKIKNKSELSAEWIEDDDEELDGEGDYSATANESSSSSDV